MAAARTCNGFRIQAWLSWCRNETPEDVCLRRISRTILFQSPLEVALRVISDRFRMMMLSRPQKLMGIPLGCVTSGCRHWWPALRRHVCWNLCRRCWRLIIIGSVSFDRGLRSLMKHLALIIGRALWSIWIAMLLFHVIASLGPGDKQWIRLRSRQYILQEIRTSLVAILHGSCS